MLTLNALEMSQSGAYQCFARNALGTTYATSRIQVTPPSDDLDLAKAMKEGFSQHEMQDIQPDSQSEFWPTPNTSCVALLTAWCWLF